MKGRGLSQLMTVVVGGLSLLQVWGCGPVMSKKDRWTWTPYDAKEWMQERDDIVVENRDFHEYPPELVATAQACKGNLLLVDYANQPVMEQVYLGPPGGRFFNVTMTNNTTHVIRLNRSAFRLLDPSGNQYEPVGADEMQAMLSSNRPCPSTPPLLPRYKTIKLYNRNVEIVPHSSFTGWLVFQPASFYIPGTWKLAIYEIPSRADQAGKVTKTTQFEVRSIFKHYVDQYYQENAFAPAQLKSSAEVQ